MNTVIYVLYVDIGFETDFFTVHTLTLSEWIWTFIDLNLRKIFINLYFYPDVCKVHYQNSILCCKETVFTFPHIILFLLNPKQMLSL